MKGLVCNVKHDTCCHWILSLDGLCWMLTPTTSCLCTRTAMRSFPISSFLQVKHHQCKLDRHQCFCRISILAFFALSDGNFLAVSSHDNFVYIYSVTENGRKYSRVGKCTVSAHPSENQSHSSEHYNPQENVYLQLWNQFLLILFQHFYVMVIKHSNWELERVASLCCCHINVTSIHVSSGPLQLHHTCGLVQRQLLPHHQLRRLWNPLLCVLCHVTSPHVEFGFIY